MPERVRCPIPANVISTITGIVYTMSFKNAKSFNSLVYDMACKRLKLKRREKIIFFRLLAFLIRSDKPFGYTVEKISELTGYARASVFESLNLLEKLRIIERIGHTSRVKFAKGRIMIRVCSLVQKRTNIELNKKQTLVQNSLNNNLVKIDTLVQFLDKTAPASPVSGYQKTSFSFKHKEKDSLSIFSSEDLRDFNEYLGSIRSDIRLGLLPRDITPLKIADWINSGKPKKQLECMDKNC